MYLKVFRKEIQMLKKENINLKDEIKIEYKENA
jgi:hypothetical protein